MKTKIKEFPVWNYNSELEAHCNFFKKKKKKYKKVMVFPQKKQDQTKKKREHEKKAARSTEPPKHAACRLHKEKRAKQKSCGMVQLKHENWPLSPKK